MEPFPATRRRIYFFSFLAVFILALPAVLLYADGWRFKSGYGLVKTGGVYVQVPYADADVSLNGAPVGRSGFLQRNFYVDDLAPAAYVVRVEKDGYRSWGRILVVEPQLVTDVRAILIPSQITVSRIIPDTASSTAGIPTAAYDAYVEAFATSSAASSTVPVDQQGGIALFIDDGDVIARWMRDALPPSIFCGSPSLCEREMSVKRGGGDALDARFWGGGIVYRTEEGAIYFTEADIRPTPVSAQIFSAPGADMRIIDGALILKAGNGLYQVEGF